MADGVDCREGSLSLEEMPQELLARTLWAAETIGQCARQTLELVLAPVQCPGCRGRAALNAFLIAAARGGVAARLVGMPVDRDAFARLAGEAFDRTMKAALADPAPAGSVH